MDIIKIENQHGAGVYAKQPLVIVRGQGASLFDADGVEYLDCSSGHGVANLGHAHPKIAEALYRQASTLITLFESFPNDQRAMLMEKITALVPGLDRVFFATLGRNLLKPRSSLHAFQRDEKILSRRCGRFMEEPMARSRQRSIKNIAKDSNRSCLGLVMWHTTMSKRWIKR